MYLMKLFRILIYIIKKSVLYKITIIINLLLINKLSINSKQLRCFKNNREKLVKINFTTKPVELTLVRFLRNNDKRTKVRSTVSFH